MPPTEVPDLISCLDSAVVGGLLHVLGATTLSLWPSVHAARLFGRPEGEPSCVVDARRLGLPVAWENSLQTWPRNEGSLFDLALRCDWRNRAGRPAEWLRGDSADTGRVYRPIDMHTTIVDALAASVTIDRHHWAMVVLLRCGQDAPFVAADLEHLSRAAPTMASVIRRSLVRQLTLELPPTPADRAAVPTGVPVAKLLLRLSKAERAILDYLLDGLTEAQTAHRLNRSRHTVHVHVKSIYRKLGVNSRVEMVKFVGR